MSFETGISAKWLELLKEIAPGVKRAAVLRTLATAAGPGQFGAIQAVASSLGVELRPIDTQDAGEIELAIVAFASEPNGGLIAATGGGVLKHRELTIALAARHRLPAVYATASGRPWRCSAAKSASRRRSKRRGARISDTRAC
jgi:putative ABC transport system substrate-binding protein